MPPPQEMRPSYLATQGKEPLQSRQEGPEVLPVGLRDAPPSGRPPEKPKLSCPSGTPRLSHAP